MQGQGSRPLHDLHAVEKHAAERDGYADALMYDYRGQVAEATGANMFLIKDGVIHTPTPIASLTASPGAPSSRWRGCTACEVVERHIMPDELDKASEVFLCGTAVEVTPVREIGDRTFKPGALTRTLMEDYDEEVRREVPKT